MFLLHQALFFLCLTPTVLLASCPCNDTVSWNALSDLFHSTQGRYWVRNARWLEPGTSVCDWFGISCTTIHLAQNALVGTLPPSLADLTQLQVVNISDNSLSGTLPPEYKAWRSLNYFSVDDNKLTGPIPAAYRAWQNLTFVDLSRNLLSGTLPPELGDWEKLTWVSLANNNFSGSLPPQYSRWRDVDSFSALSNQLTGTLPPEYAAWRQLKRITVSSNALTGSLPPEYSAWNATVTLISFWRNQLSSTLPPEYAALTNLRDLIFGQNKLTGTIPPSYGARLQQLNVLSLEDNDFSGTMPFMTVTQVLGLYNNRRLRGPIPKSMGVTLFVSVCNTSLCGPIPASWSLSVFGCQQVTDYSTRAMASVIPVPHDLPLCPTSAPLPPSTTDGATDDSRQVEEAVIVPTSPLLRDAAEGAGVVGLLAGGVAFGGLQVSMRTVRIASRIAACAGQTDDIADETGNEAVAMGVAVIDSPTRISLPGSASQTTGAVVGNVMLLVCVPLAVAGAVGASRRCCGSRLDVVHVSAAAWLVLFGLLQTPLAAAVSALVVDSITSASVQSGMVAVLGAVASVLPVGSVFAAYWAKRQALRGQVLDSHHRRSRMRWRDADGCTQWCRWQYTDLFGRRRSSWDESMWTELSVVAAPLPYRFLFSVVAHLLDGVQYPLGWVVVSDMTFGLLQGVFVGMATSEQCVVAAFGAWMLVGVCLVQLLHACVSRPRSTHAECAMACTMSLWTAAACVAAALGIKRGSHESALCQGIVQILWCLPIMWFRMRTARWTRRDEAESKSQGEAQHDVSSSVICTTTAPGVLHHAVGQSERRAALSELVQMICQQRQHSSSRRAELTAPTSEVK